MVYGQVVTVVAKGTRRPAEISEAALIHVSNPTGIWQTTVSVTNPDARWTLGPRFVHLKNYQPTKRFHSLHWDWNWRERHKLVSTKPTTNGSYYIKLKQVMLRPLKHTISPERSRGSSRRENEFKLKKKRKTAIIKYVYIYMCETNNYSKILTSPAARLKLSFILAICSNWWFLFTCSITCFWINNEWV